MDKKTFGQLLIALRHKANISQKELADRLFITQPAVSKWERGLALPDIELLAKISDLFSIPVETLLKPETYFENETTEIHYDAETPLANPKQPVSVKLLIPLILLCIILAGCLAVLCHLLFLKKQPVVVENPSSLPPVFCDTVGFCEDETYGTVYLITCYCEEELDIFEWNDYIFNDLHHAWLCGSLDIPEEVSVVKGLIYTDEEAQSNQLPTDHYFYIYK